MRFGAKRASAALTPAVLALSALLCLGAAASDPAERLPDPAREAHARALFRQIRCLVCQNESIDESEADLADDLRRVVREQIMAGRSDAQIKAFLVHRYNEFVLLKPRLSPSNAALWLTPFAIVGVGGVLLVLRRPKPEPPPLSPAEEADLQALAATATVPPQAGLTKGLEA